MKVRMLVAGILLLAGFCAVLLVSGAPLRVHVAHGTTWLPITFVGCLIYWNQGLSRRRKIVLLGSVSVLGALLASSAISWVTSKFEVDAIAVLGNAIFLLLGVMAIGGLTNLLTRIFGIRIAGSE